MPMALMAQEEEMAAVEDPMADQTTMVAAIRHPMVAEADSIQVVGAEVVAGNQEGAEVLAVAILMARSVICVAAVPT